MLLPLPFLIVAKTASKVQHNFLQFTDILINILEKVCTDAGVVLSF
jgi:hypothetical protein